MIDKTTTTEVSACGTQNCSSRLPCGVCMILGKPCPMVTNFLEPTWTSNQLNITCSVSDVTSITSHSFELDDSYKEKKQ